MKLRGSEEGQSLLVIVGYLLPVQTNNNHKWKMLDSSRNDNKKRSDWAFGLELCGKKDGF